MISRIILTAALIVAINCRLSSEVISLHSKETLTVVELNSGDRVDFTLSGGRTVSFEIMDSRVDILFTSLDTMKRAKAGEASIFSMTCKVKIDGQVMEMVRFVPVQETYYKPYVVNGLTVWFDALRELQEYFTENHGKCLPAKEARFAFNEAGTQICPQELSNWWPEPANRVFIKDGYMGEDSWLGTYFGAELHGGLDVNMPSNTPITAPIDFDEHYFFNSVKAGDNNNRWRGVRYWENGDIWYLQTHHINELVVPQYIPLKQGDVFAHGAGTWCGYSPHSHFVFNTYQPEFDNWILMDPWVILWQIFENNRRKANAIIAAIEPLAPVHTGEQVHFSSKGSRPSIYGGEFEFFWDFGDGYTSFAENPMHVYLEPGIYPVTFTVRNGYSTDSYTQHITVNGKAVTVTSLSFTSEQEPSFRRRPAWKTSAYGTCLDIVNTVIFRSYQDSKEEPAAKTISIWFNKSTDQGNTNSSDNLNGKPRAILPVYRHGDDWLEIERIPNKDHVDLKIRP
ncbi:MAG: PKD domain-containing protein, partial [Anaerolineales bacterium]